MEDPNPQTGRMRSRPQRELVVQRGFEMERVERTLLAAAYETVWPLAPSLRCHRPRESRHAETGTAGCGPIRAPARSLGRRAGPSLLVAMGG